MTSCGRSLGFCHPFLQVVETPRRTSPTTSKRTLQTTSRCASALRTHKWRRSAMTALSEQQLWFALVPQIACLQGLTSMFGMKTRVIAFPFPSEKPWKLLAGASRGPSHEKKQKQKSWAAVFWCFLAFLFGFSSTVVTPLHQRIIFEPWRPPLRSTVMATRKTAMNFQERGEEVWEYLVGILLGGWFWAFSGSDVVGFCMVLLILVAFCGCFCWSR